MLSNRTCTVGPYLNLKSGGLAYTLKFKKRVKGAGGLQISSRANVFWQTLIQNQRPKTSLNGTRLSMTAAGRGTKKAQNHLVMYVFL